MNIGLVRSAAARVRLFGESDVVDVAGLHNRVFNSADGKPPVSMEAYKSFFGDVFSNDRSRALVYEEADGAIAGFQGVQMRSMLWRGKPLRAAVLSHYAVEPARRGIPGIRLLKHALDGPQDFSISDESSDAARKIWEWCGGRTALLYSMHWIRPLRPGQTIGHIAARKRPLPFAAVAKPLLKVCDAISGRRGPLARRRPSGTRSELTAQTMVEHMAELTGNYSLRPDYGDGSLPWLLQRANTRDGGGPLRKMLVRDEHGAVAGWFLYYAKRGGFAQVLQIVARKETIGQVLDHLIEDAFLAGAAALAGRLDPMFADELSARYFVFLRRGHWMLMHSKRPELLDPFDRGDAFFSRFEGEWCLHLS